MDEILRQAFARARHRVGLIFLDIVWKAIWLAGTVTAVFFVAVWFGSELRGIAWEDTGVRAVNALIMGMLFRQFWAANGAAIILSVTSVIALSASAWFVLEAFVRYRMVGVVAGFRPRPDPEPRRMLTPVIPYVMSRIAKTVVLAAFALILAAVYLNGAPILALILFLPVAFGLSLVETLIRADAVELIGTDLIRVTGLLGILMLFEMMMVVAFGVMLVAGFLNVARPTDAVVMLGSAGISLVFLNMLHSYLLLVRFSVVGIMRQNVVAV